MSFWKNLLGEAGEQKPLILIHGLLDSGLFLPPLAGFTNG
jgi:hypothetical protein